MKRRTVLAGVAGGLGAVAGCLTGPRGGTPSDRSPGPHTQTPSRWCEQAFTTRDGTTDDCTGTRFEYVGTRARSDATTAPGQTRYEGTFDDYLVVAITTDASEALELRGCVRGRYEGEDRSLPVARSIDADRSDVRFEFGPFSHPGGVSEWHLWIRGCAAEVRQP